MRYLLALSLFLFFGQASHAQHPTQQSIIGKWGIVKITLPGGVLFDLDDRAGTHDRLIKQLRFSDSTDMMHISDSAEAEKHYQHIAAIVEGVFFELFGDKTWRAHLPEKNGSDTASGTYTCDSLLTVLRFYERDIRTELKIIHFEEDTFVLQSPGWENDGSMEVTFRRKK